MRYTKYITALLLSTILMVACKEDTTPFFINERIVQFTFKYQEIINENDYYKLSYSFGHKDPSMTEAIVKIPVEFNGYDLVEGLEYSVMVDDEKTNLPSNCYELEERQLFRTAEGKVDSLRNIDNLEIKLIRANISEKKTIRIKLVSNENFKASMTDSLFVELTVDDIFGMPEWWGVSVIKSYLGEYSQKKYATFLSIAKNDTESEAIENFGLLDSSEKKYYALMFKKYLFVNPTYEDDEKTILMEVSVIG